MKNFHEWLAVQEGILPPWLGGEKKDSMLADPLYQKLLQHFGDEEKAKALYLRKDDPNDQMAQMEIWRATSISKRATPPDEWKQRDAISRSGPEMMGGPRSSY